MSRRSESGVRNKQIARKKRKHTGNLNTMLRMCLEKVCELQQELNEADDCEEDAQAAGYAACAIEALAFLANEGLPQNHPMVKVLTDKLTSTANDNSPQANCKDQPAQGD